jgi:hypothetical protein
MKRIHDTNFVLADMPAPPAPMKRQRDPVVVKYDPPPIPFRGGDYTATFGDWDLDDPLGTGATPDEAIADLMIEAEMYDE